MNKLKGGKKKMQKERHSDAQESQEEAEELVQAREDSAEQLEEINYDGEDEKIASQGDYGNAFKNET